MVWQYKVFAVDQFLNSDKNLTLEEKLNKYGEDGWELVGVVEKPPVGVGWLPKIDSDSIVFKKAVET